MVRDGLFADGRKKAGVFDKLNASALNWRLNRSRKAKFRNTEKSRFSVAGPRAARRARLPNCVIGVPFTFNTWVGTEKAAGLKYPFGPAFGRYMEAPLTALGTLNVANIWDGIKLVRISVGSPSS